MNTQKKIATLLGILALVTLMVLGLRNRPDPIWQQTERLLRQDFYMLDDAADSVRWLFHQFHGLTPPLPTDEPASQSLGFRILKTPFLPTAEWKKFREAFSWLEKNHAAVVASVNGSGATTLTHRIANFIAVRPENCLEIKCAPHFDISLHQKYIGHEDEHGKFHPGEMLQLWQRAAQHPDQRFVAVLDNFDKINPETFFGPELWEKLGEPKTRVHMGGTVVEIPDNFYLLSVVHAGGAGKITFTNEHFRRLGGLHILQPTPVELIEYLRNRKKEIEKDLQSATDSSKILQWRRELSALQDTPALTRFVCFFSKMNALLSEKYAPSHQLGQWSNIRKMYRSEDFSTLRTTFLNHINSLEPSRQLTEKDLEDIDYTLKTNGLEANSHFFARQIKWLQDTGYFVETTLIAATSIITALAGWWVFRRRERLLRKYGERTRHIFEAFEQQQLSAEEASVRLEAVKTEVDELVMRRKINYTEALYFLTLIDDKVRRVEFAKNTTETFLDLMNSFLEDEILTENEYKKLVQFLQSIQYKIPKRDYERFRNEVERIYQDYREK